MNLRLYVFFVQSKIHFLDVFKPPVAEVLLLGMRAENSTFSRLFAVPISLRCKSGAGDAQQRQRTALLSLQMLSQLRFKASQVLSKSAKSILQAKNIAATGKPKVLLFLFSPPVRFPSLLSTSGFYPQPMAFPSFSSP